VGELDSVRLAFFLFAVTLRAQTLTLTVTEPFAYPGSVLDAVVTFQDTGPTSGISGFEWTITAPAGVTLGTPIIGVVGSSVQCATNCVATAPSGTTFSSNIIATIPITFSSTIAPGAVQITFGNLTAVNLAGNAIAVMTPTPSVSVTVNASTGTTVWFTATAGTVKCTVSKVAQIPIRLTYLIQDTYGSRSGSYTASPYFADSNAGVSYFTIDLNSISLPPIATANLSCTISINSTLNPQTSVNGVILQPNSAAYSCSGFTGSSVPGPVVTWP